MKTKKGREPLDSQETIKELKDKYLTYYEELPIHSLACGFIGRSESRVKYWRDTDPAFAEAIERAKALHATNNAKQVKSREWILERTMRNHFAPPQSSIDLTSGNEPIVWDMSNVMGIRRGRPKKD